MGQETPTDDHLAQTAFDQFRTTFLARRPGLPPPTPATWAAVVAIATDPLRSAADRALVLTDPDDLPEPERDRRYRLILNHRLSSARPARHARSHRRLRPFAFHPPLAHHTGGPGRHRSSITPTEPEPFSGYGQTDQTGGSGATAAGIHPPQASPNGDRR